MTTPSHCIVVTDANILINLMHVARLDLCANLPDYGFVIPDHVREEIKNPSQRAALDDAIARDVFRVESITEIDTIALFDELIAHIKRGEAACLALAVEHGWTVASDEKRRFRREAENRIGRDRIIGTREIYLRAIGAGLLTIDEADADKTLLAGRRFKMEFESFAELMERPST